ncbi:hypothetical protein F4804DRAFT_303490 [Jackrogersella minutella]|nr:hypothetical protein F4804DRAFT_303490 [Jackrogersella minutella]
MQNASLNNLPSGDLSLGAPAYNNMALDTIHPPASSETQHLPDTRCRFLSIPTELRLRIYKFAFNGELEDSMSIWQKMMGSIYMFSPFPGTEKPTTPIALIRVCKQINAELASQLYKKIHICCRLLSIWVKFFKQIGPRNGAFVQELTIDRDCSHGDYEVGCQGEKSQMWEGEYKELFESLTYANVNPKHLTMRIFPCLGFVPLPVGPGHRLFDIFELTSDNTFRSNGKPVDCYEYTHCQIHNDLSFLRSIYSLCGNIQRIELAGSFNPLWGFALRQRFGLVVKRETTDYNCAYWAEGFFQGGWTLINPKFTDAAVELEDYSPSAWNPEIYTRGKEEYGGKTEREHYLNKRKHSLRRGRKRRHHG